MKKIGLILVVFGLLITVFTGFSFVTREKVVDVGTVQITKNKNHPISWPPFIGFVVMGVGAGLYLLSRKQS